MGPEGAQRRPHHLPLLYARRGHLAISLAAMGLLALSGALWPNEAGSPLGRWVAVAVALGVTALLLVVLPEHRLLMPSALVLGILSAGVLVASCLISEDTVVVSLGVLAAAQFAVYAFPARTAVGMGALCLAVITAGMIVAPAPFHLVSWIVVVVVLVVSTSLFGYVIHWLRRYASTDDLTGALTRGALLQRMTADLRETRRTGSPLTVVSVDVDHFKAINDTRGHLAGDEVLAELAHGWRGLLGPRDTIGRVGGDEFVLLLPGRDAESADRWLADARGVAPAPWSAGTASAARTDTVRDLLDRADVALYAAKAARAPR
jgi:diguanylate cyclase (GGDEF)-like protein